MLPFILNIIHWITAMISIITESLLRRTVKFTMKQECLENLVILGIGLSIFA